jgi:hypothetical protein
MSNNLPDALAFKSPLDWDAIWHKLKELGHFEWKGGESEYNGVYMRGESIPPDWPVWLRIYEEKTANYLLEFDYKWYRINEGHSPIAVIAFVENTLLPALEAFDVRATQGVR